jgi:hypothetical protein
MKQRLEAVVVHEKKSRLFLEAQLPRAQDRDEAAARPLLGHH